MRRIRRLLTAAALAALALWWLLRLAAPGPPLAPFAAVREAFSLPALELARPTESLVGRVLDGEGRAAPGVLVSTVSGEAVRWTFSDENGAFRLQHLVAGEHEVFLVAFEHAPSSQRTAVPADSAPVWTLAPPFPTPFALEPVVSRDLLGRLRPAFEDRDPAGYQVIFVPRAFERPPSAPDGSLERRTRTDSEGAFRVPELVLGDYEVLVVPPWAEGRAGPQLLRRSYQHQAQGSELVLAVQAGELRGLVLDALGRPVPDALVELLDAAQPTRLLPHLHSDENGRFSARDVPAGTWRLRVSAGPWEHDQLVRISPLRAERIEVQLGLNSSGR